MKPVMLDTDILSLYFRGNEKVVFHMEKYLANNRLINISIITYYEIISGLKHCDSKKQLDKFLEFSKLNNILPLTKESAVVAAEIYAIQRKKGKAIDDIDLLISGIAITNNLILITHNSRHFSKIPNLEILDWSN